MKKLLVLILCISMLLSYALLLTSCKAGEPGDNTPNDPTPTPPANPNEPTIVVPPYKDYGRDTVNYTDLVYERPNVAAIILDFEAVVQKIEESDISFEEQLALIVGLEESYNAFLTMSTLANIGNSVDSSNEFWLEEYTYLTTNRSEFTQAVEDLYVAAAKSEYKQRFEDEYFGFSLDEYVDGGIYTDRLVELMAKEAEYIAEYNGFSPDSVIITNTEGVSGTVNELLSSVPSHKYNSYYTLYMQYYMNEVIRLTKLLYIELIKVRMDIAEEMGKDSYIEVGYENLGHDYSPDAVMQFLGDIKETVIISSDMYYNNFYHLMTELEPNAKTVDVINKLYTLFSDMDEGFGEVYAYMLQHGLYNIAKGNDNRQDGAYTTYIHSNNSPFMFVSANEKIGDYVTVAHEFGHFVDAYYNDGLDASLDLAEVYSQALSYLMLLDIKDSMQGTKDLQRAYRYMLHSEMEALSNILMYQGYLATFEHMVFELDKENVTEDKLLELMEEAQIYCWGYEIASLQSWDSVLIVHTVEYPFYVQSYCTSLVAAVEIMLMEIEEAGTGIQAFKTLLQREGYDELTFEEQLARAGIKSPLKKGALMDMFTGVYRFITGKNYISPSDKHPDAA